MAVGSTTNAMSHAVIGVRRSQAVRVARRAGAEGATCDAGATMVAPAAAGDVGTEGSDTLEWEGIIPLSPVLRGEDGC
jgi:hypothetical protein